jgi:hypothetical protein
MSQVQIVYPMLAMLLLTVVVLVATLRERAAEVKARGLAMRDIPSGSQMATVLHNTRAADHCKNLFEMPVFFYALCLALLATEMVGAGIVAAAWLYVALRAAHCWIHLTYNRIRHRRRVFAASTTLLLVMWIAFAVQLALRGS